MRENGTSRCRLPHAKSFSSAGLVKCKGTTTPEQKLHSVLTRCFPSTLFHHQTERRLLVTCYLTGTGLHAWQALNQTITLWHSSLTVTLTSPILAFPVALRLLFLLPCLSSFTSLPFFPFTSPFMSAGSASQFPPFSHSLPPPTLSPLLIHFHVATFHQWSAFLARLPPAHLLPPPLTEWMQH